MTTLGKAKPVRAAKGKKPRVVPARTRKKRLIKALDDLVSLIVRYRDGGCVTPNANCYGNLTASHYFKRENWGIRWSLVNVNCQCQGHNNSHNNHDFPYGDWMRRQYGNDVGGRLLEEEATYRAGSKAGCKYTEVELQEKLDELTAYFDALKSRSIYIERS